MAASLDCCASSTSGNSDRIARRNNISRQFYNVTKYSSSSRITSAGKRMNGNLSNNKILIVITIVIGCMAILWPTVFYPMLQAAFSSQSTTKQVPYIDRTGARGSMHPAMMHPRLREEMTGESRTPREAPLSARLASRAGDQSGSLDSSTARPMPAHLPTAAGPGVAGLFIPLYFILVVMFLFYTLVIVVRRNDVSTETRENVASARDDYGKMSDTSCCTSNTPYYPHDIWTAQGKFNPRTIQSTRNDDESSVAQCVDKAKREITKLATACSNINVDRLIGAFPSDQIHSTNHIHNHTASPLRQTDKQSYNIIHLQDKFIRPRPTFHAALKDKREENPSNQERDDEDHLKSADFIFPGGKSDPFARRKSSPSLAHIDVDTINLLREKLQMKEKIIEKLLASINGLGSRLVDAGVLPSLPGLFSGVKKTEKDLSDDSRDENNGPSNDSNCCDTSIDYNCLSTDETEKLEKQLAASTQFIASLGAANSKRVSPAHRSIITSKALRLLVQNMKLFEYFLIEVEDLRRRLNHLEARRPVTLDTIDEQSSSSHCGCNDSCDRDFDECHERGPNQAYCDHFTCNCAIDIKDHTDLCDNALPVVESVEEAVSGECDDNDQLQEAGCKQEKSHASSTNTKWSLSQSSDCHRGASVKDELKCIVENEKKERQIEQRSAEGRKSTELYDSAAKEWIEEHRKTLEDDEFDGSEDAHIESVVEGQNIVEGLDVQVDAPQVASQSIQVTSEAFHPKKTRARRRNRRRNKENLTNHSRV